MGKRILYTLGEGKAVSVKYLESEQTIKRGDEVMLETTSKGMTVSIKTVAMQNASVGDAIRLRRFGGKGEYVAKVAGPGKATVLTQEDKQ